jgi:biotin-(acetyl-CoA carboxylase) ligase
MPDLDAESIRRRLALRRPACLDYRLEYRHTVDSTSNVVGILGGEGLREGVVLVASEQLAGTGQNRRRWYSRSSLAGGEPCGASTAPANVTLAVVLREPPTLRQFALERLAAALSAIEALVEVAGDPGLPIWVRGPNDVYSYHPDRSRAVPYRKIAGILAASDHCPEALAALGAIPAAKPAGLEVLGIGINLADRLLATPLDGAPGRTLADLAIALETLTGVLHPPEPVIAAFLERLDANLDAVRREPPDQGVLARLGAKLARDAENSATFELAGEPRSYHSIVLPVRLLAVTGEGFSVERDGQRSLLPFEKVARFYPRGAAVEAR